MIKYLKTPLKYLIKGLLYLIDKDHRSKEEISMDDMKKFTHIQPTNFKSDFGTVDTLFRTVPYQVWKLTTTSHELTAADKHRVIRENGETVWLEDLLPGDRIKTNTGVEEVVECKDLGIRTHMYCTTVNTQDPEDPNNHLFYTNGILSHNTTCSAAFMLWKAMFTPDCTILIVANKYVQAQEILDRIKYGYESLEAHNWLRPGVVEYNQRRLIFDNKSELVVRATAPDAGRGLSISLLYCLDGESMVTIRDKETQEIKDISLEELYVELENEKFYDSEIELDDQVTFYTSV